MSLSKHLFEVKGESYKGERVYKVEHQDFYQMMFKETKILKTFVRKMAEVLDLIAGFGVVHCDIKPDNILISIEKGDIKDLKLIDFGSAFYF